MEKQLASHAILQVLTNETDENHSIQMSTLMSELSFTYGIDTERHAVGRNINMLKVYDYPIAYSPSDKGYALIDHLLTKTEQFILCNCIHASPFLTEKSSNALIIKLQETGSRFYKAEYQSIIYHPNPRKIENPQFMANMTTVYDAIAHGYKVSFDYMHYGADMKMHIKNKEPIIVEPRYIAYQLSQAYLIVTGGKYPGFMVFRFDKIANVKTIRQKVKALDSDMDACEYSNSKLFMYNGENMNVTFKIKKDKLDQIVDAFGNTFHPHEYGSEHYLCTVKTTDNAALIFAQKYMDIVEIIEPKILRSKLRNRLYDACAKYSEK